jgi:hypothetical protein
MDINVRAKFNIGDIIYIVDSYYDHWHAVQEGFEVCSVQVNVRQGKCRINYELKANFNGYQPSYDEQWCFATYEDAVEWCNKHNK